MGQGDETNYVYLIHTSRTTILLNHLVNALDHSQYTIDDAGMDRKANILFDDVRFTLPIYAISNKHFTGKSGFRPANDIEVELKPGGPAISFDSGVWCEPENIFDSEQADRTAHVDNRPFRLTHIQIELASGANYLRLKLGIWGGMYWGGTEEDPSFEKLVTPLKAMCEAWIFEDQTGAYCYTPELDDETQERFGDYYQENDYLEDLDPDEIADALREFLAEGQD